MFGALGLRSCYLIDIIVLVLFSLRFGRFPGRLIGRGASGCGFLHQNKVLRAACDTGVLGCGADLGRYFFISMPPEALPGAGFGKRISQNLVFKELRSQNLDNKRLRVA